MQFAKYDIRQVLRSALVIQLDFFQFKHQYTFKYEDFDHGIVRISYQSQQITTFKIGQKFSNHIVDEYRADENFNDIISLNEIIKYFDIKIFNEHIENTKIFI